ncbi:MAG: ATP synthase subunit I [Jatrophihabitantaceae bacterium]
MQPVATPPVDAIANLRRSSIVAAGLGLVSIVVLAILGHPFMGVFATVGLALGAFNNRLLQLSVLSYASTESMKKGQFTRRVLLRLGFITAVAFGLALLVQPDGLGVFAGLAVFQVLMLTGASIPVFRSLRHS